MTKLDVRPNRSRVTINLDGISDRDLLVYSEFLNEFVHQPQGLNVSFVITDDAGIGDVASDANATDYTGQTPIIGTAASIPAGASATFVHKDVAYTWVGPDAVTVGVGGDHVAVTGDFAAIGTADHTLLTNLDVIDQHPQDVIVDLVTDQAAQDQTFTDHITTATEPDPHPLYALEANALAIFTGAAYGGIELTGPDAMSTIDDTWQTIVGFDIATVVTPRLVVQDLANDGIRLEHQGIWILLIDMSLTFVEAQAGRELHARIFNATAAVPIGNGTINFIGRNTAGATIARSIMGELSQAAENDLLQLQVSSPADIFTTVVNLETVFQAFHISEFKGVL